MKLNKSYFMGLFITFLMVWIAGIVAWVTIINTNPNNELLHKGRLHTLYFGNSNDVWIKVQSGASYLSVLNGLIVWDNLSASNASWSMIWWWDWNKIYAQNAWIAWWQYNEIQNWAYSAIGWGNHNILWWENSVVAWWSGNRAWNGAVIVGWESNEWSGYWVVLWGFHNVTSGNNSLVMWSWSKWSEGSFVWNDGSAEHSQNVPENSARIDASNGVLIWTNQRTTGVRLVVNWAVKLWSGNNNFTWEMSVDWNGCIWASDGVTGHVLGKGSESECTVITWCLFGSTLIQNGDKVTAYVKPYSTDCTGLEAREIMCNGSELCLSDWTQCGYSYDKYYPYCYKVSASNDREYPSRYKIIHFDGVSVNPNLGNGHPEQTVTQDKDLTQWVTQTPVYQGGATHNP